MTAQVNKIINDLLEDTAILIAQRTDRETERECLEMGKKGYENKKDWVKVASYQGAIQRVTREIEILDELIQPRLAEIRGGREQVSESIDNFLTPKYC